jgi:AcrR family transcriptional regulator
MPAAKRTSKRKASGSTRVRMPAAERREQLLRTASRAFSETGYHATTTSQIARAAGVSEPVLYHHFASKRDLYVACVGETWSRMRERWQAAIDDEDDPAMWTVAMAMSIFGSGAEDDMQTDVWSQAICEPNDDPHVRAFVSGHLAEIHAFIAGVYRRQQEAGAMGTGHDPEAEAWVFIAIGLLRSADTRIGNLVAPKFGEIVMARREWLGSGREAAGA